VIVGIAGIVGIVGTATLLTLAARPVEATKPCPPSPCRSPSGELVRPACEEAAIWVAVGVISRVVHHPQGPPLSKDFAEFTFTTERWEKGDGKAGQAFRFKVGWCDNQEPPRGTSTGKPWRSRVFGAPSSASGEPRYLFLELLDSNRGGLNGPTHATRRIRHSSSRGAPASAAGRQGAIRREGGAATRIAIAATGRRLAGVDRIVAYRAAVYAGLELVTLPVEGGPGFPALFELVDRTGLRAHDALYLQLALSRGAALATLDASLRGASRAEGVPVVPDLPERLEPGSHPVGQRGKRRKKPG
jgi:hypothetical protein